MGQIRVSEELHRAIEAQMREGRAASADAFVEEAVISFLDDDLTPDDEIVRSALAGIADIEAGRHTTIGRLKTRSFSSSDRWRD